MSVNSQYASDLRELKTKQAHLLEEVGDQWRTPEDLFWGINAVFGPFDMDLFTDGDNAHCARYYTAEDNALTQDWTADLNGGKGFANPPYSRPCKDEDGNDMTGMITIMNKAKTERDQGAKLAFLIRGVPSETWWPELADHICFIKGRVGFKLPDWFIPANDKQKASSAGFAGAIAIFDKEWRGGPISYIHRDSLRAQGKKLLDMVEAAAEKKAATYITGTIETRPETAVQGEPIIAPQVSAQIDIEEQIAKVLAEPANSVWPIEVLKLVQKAFEEQPNKFNELRHRVLCEKVNKLRLDNVSDNDILSNLIAMLEKCEPMGVAA
ncbi:phage N-6-adenine-methyltransferase [Shewanella profunda]|uniref:phage N-6-adenine-methyltransferase n=1 Tax=Shewanella profunda TaxID=254793 RepID=UPI00200C1497|nr:phage N-6-adenine-methyltransferase [Shewanella profunda]MCL1088033.1 phage N-6-adenine-methyltransferase [Shewanella profunda]